MLNAPDGYRHSIPMEIRFADIDSLGHVNNAAYLTYMEQARLRYVRDVGVGSSRPYHDGGAGEVVGLCGRLAAAANARDAGGQLRGWTPTAD